MTEMGRDENDQCELINCTFWNAIDKTNCKIKNTKGWDDNSSKI